MVVALVDLAEASELPDDTQDARAVVEHAARIHAGVDEVQPQLVEMRVDAVVALDAFQVMRRLQSQARREPLPPVLLEHRIPLGHTIRRRLPSRLLLFHA